VAGTSQYGLRDGQHRRNKSDDHSHINFLQPGEGPPGNRQFWKWSSGNSTSVCIDGRLLFALHQQTEHGKMPSQVLLYGWPVQWVFTEKVFLIRAMGTL